MHPLHRKLINDLVELEQQRVRLALAAGWVLDEECTFDLFFYQPTSWPRYAGTPARVNWTGLPYFFNDANHDYWLRDHFVQKGRAETLGDALHDLIVERRDPTANPLNHGLSIHMDAVDIQCGDWSRAAVKMLNLEKES